MISSGYAPFSNGGVEVMTQVLAEALILKNIKVTVIIFGDDEKEYYINDVKVRICRSKEFHLKSKRLTYILNRLLQMYNPFCKKILKKILDEEKPDIIHVQMLRKASYYVYNICKKERIRTVVTLHEIFSLWNFNPFDQFKNMLISKPNMICRMVRNMQRRASKNVGVVTAPCQWIIDAYTKEGYFVDCDTKVICNALPFDDDETEKILHEKEKKVENDKCLRFLYIGRMDVFKGIELILDALKDIKDQSIEVHFAGEGPLKAEVQRVARQDKRIIVHGYVDGEDKKKLFCETDVLLFLSEDIETFGLVCMEAMSYSLPIIASDIRSTSLFVKNGYNGTILNTREKDCLIESMEMYHDKNMLMIQAMNNHQMLKQFDFSRFVDDTVKVYENVLVHSDK